MKDTVLEAKPKPRRRRKQTALPKLARRPYEAEKAEMQAELLKVQLWAQETGQRFVLLFEGRDAAGKGGTSKRFTEHLNPRAARVVALNKPTDEERGQWYFQRYMEHLPTSGEMVLYDRSWYNRAGVERGLGCCEPEGFRGNCPLSPKRRWTSVMTTPRRKRRRSSTPILPMRHGP